MESLPQRAVLSHDRFFAARRMRECPEFDACHRIRADRGGGWRRACGTERNGYFEGRQPFPIVVDSGWYAAHYPEIGAAIETGTLESAQLHFERHGYREGRLPFPV
jgi:hypothetical protein